LPWIICINDIIPPRSASLSRPDGVDGKNKSIVAERVDAREVVSEIDYTMEAAVIGAGIVGASCAYYLSRRGVKVRIFEQMEIPASGSTARSAAGIRHQFSHPENVRMSLYSASVFSNFHQLTAHHAGYRKVGYLFLLPRDKLERWQQQQDVQRRLGARVELLSVSELYHKFGYIEPHGLGGASYGLDDGVVDPHGITAGFLNVAREHGAILQLSTEVFQLEWHHGCWHLETNQGLYRADVVINAAGPFAAELAKRAALEIPVAPYRRNIYLTAPFENFPHPSPLIIDTTTGLYLRSEGERFLFGLSNLEEPSSTNLAVDWSWLEHTLELALHRFPFLSNAALDRDACWAGLYAITPDHHPILGRMPGLEGFFNACGFSGHGVQHAPATGLILSEEILDGEAHSFDITDYRFQRFTTSRRAGEANIV
jgi:sarcosine oxidase subunit beta